GVTVVFAGSVHGARDVAKVHPYKTDAFTSGEAGRGGAGLGG
ncbi:MAG: asparaginase, partial [Burkholderiales bacterium]|nr:asparaginase [Opitutaceae bacterium]